MTLVDLVDGHVSHRAGPNEEAIFIEDSWKVCRRLVQAAQNHSFPLHHRMSRALQGHRDIWLK